jgi:hypothetical protein
VKIPNSAFKKDTLEMWNEESFEIAVLGVPVIVETGEFRSIIIEINRDEMTKRIYEFA